jgi:FtsZ-interacting cell division protein ZipA
MVELRWALLLLGTVFLIGIGLWEWRRGRRRSGPSLRPRETAQYEAEPAHANWPQTTEDDDEAGAQPMSHETRPSRREPVIKDFGPVIDPPVVEAEVSGITADDDEADSMRIAVAADVAVDVPAASAPLAFASSADVEDSSSVADAQSQTPQASPSTNVADEFGEPPIRWPLDTPPDRVLGLRLVAPAGRPLSGQRVRLALLAAGLRYGPQQIFHRTDPQGNVLASVASLTRPGTLIPDRMDGQGFRGLNLFATLPGPLSDAELFEGLLALARLLASRLDATLQDDRGHDLDSQRVALLRQMVKQSSP